MIAMLVADSDTSTDALSRTLRPYGFDVVRYRSAVKALDNICEIVPDAVFVSATDFPRHWKAIAQFIRADTDRDRTIIVLLTGERFTSDDADKAIHIGVQATIGETIASAEDRERLIALFSRYKPSAEPRENFEYRDVAARATFLFTNPINETIITGKVESISRREMRFRPDAASATADLAAGDVLDQCSLKLDDAVIQPKCRVERNGSVIQLAFDGIPESDGAAIERFISEGV